MLETRRLKNVVVFFQAILSFVLSRKTRKILNTPETCPDENRKCERINCLIRRISLVLICLLLLAVTGLEMIISLY